jgi:Sugar (and other) transporter
VEVGQVRGFLAWKGVKCGKNSGKFSFVSAAVIAPSILILLIMPESPTWFLSKGRMEEMRRSERWIARLSGQSPDSASSPVTKQDYEQCDQQNFL